MSSNSMVHIPGVGSFTHENVDVITKKILSLMSGCSFDSDGKPIFGELTCCRRCGSADIQKRGVRNDKQRYYCKSCKKLFVNTTNTAICGSRKNLDEWKHFIFMTVSGKTLRQCEEEYEISYVAAFSKRLKILRAVHDDYIARHPDFEIKIDEDILPASQKGNHSLNSDFSLGREARKRGPRREIDNLEGEERDICEFICRHYGGVSSKYLDLYVGWFMWLKEFKELSNEKEDNYDGE